MAAVEFGNWKIANKEVKWTDEERGLYKFPLSDFGLRGPQGREKTIDILVHLAEKTWIEKEDLADLNEAAQYAIKNLGIELDPGIDWDETIKEQTANFERYR